MACSIEFVRLTDFASDVDVLDLMSSGFSLAADGYLPVSAPDGVKSVNESITLKLQGTSKDDLADMTQLIDEKVKQIGWWLKNPSVEKYQVWLRVQLEGETYPRQAQILSILPPEQVRVFTPEERLDNYIGQYSLAIERTPFWEQPYPYPTTTSSTNAIDTLVGNVALSETIKGDVPARLAHISITPHSNGTYIADMWLGWKTSRFGSAANFISVWSLDKAFYLAGTNTSVQTDATAYDGKNQTCTFATVATLAQRVLIKVSDISASNPADQRGSYNVLLRARMSDSSVARAKIGHGFIWAGGAGLVQPAYRRRQVVSGTAWKLYEMGTVQIPSMRIYSGFDVSNYGFTIEAERTSGSGSLIMDCLVLIPTDDGALKMSAAADLSINLLAHAYQDASMHVVAQGEVSGKIALPIAQSPVDWALPANDEAPRLIFASQGVQLAGSVTGVTVDMAYTYIPRWRTLRGSEA